jgi:hypothetical protein
MSKLPRSVRARARGALADKPPVRAAAAWLNGFAPLQHEDARSMLLRLMHHAATHTRLSRFGGPGR